MPGFWEAIGSRNRAVRAAHDRAARADRARQHAQHCRHWRPSPPAPSGSRASSRSRLALLLLAAGLALAGRGLPPEGPCCSGARRGQSARRAAWRGLLRQGRGALPVDCERRRPGLPVHRPAQDAGGGAPAADGQDQLRRRERRLPHQLREGDRQRRWACRTARRSAAEPRPDPGHHCRRPVNGAHWAVSTAHAGDEPARCRMLGERPLPEPRPTMSTTRWCCRRSSTCSASMRNGRIRRTSPSGSTSWNSSCAPARPPPPAAARLGQLVGELSSILGAYPQRRADLPAGRAARRRVMTASARAAQCAVMQLSHKLGVMRSRDCAWGERAKATAGDRLVRLWKAGLEGPATAQARNAGMAPAADRARPAVGAPAVRPCRVPSRHAFRRSRHLPPRLSQSPSPRRESLALRAADPAPDPRARAPGPAHHHQPARRPPVRQLLAREVAPARRRASRSSTSTSAPAPRPRASRCGPRPSSSSASSIPFCSTASRAPTAPAS